MGIKFTLSIFGMLVFSAVAISGGSKSKGRDFYLDDCYIYGKKEKKGGCRQFQGGRYATFRRRVNPVLEKRTLLVLFSKRMILVSLVIGDSTKTEIEVVVMVMHFVFPSPMILKIVCIV